MGKPAPPLSSSQPDPRVLAVLGSIQWGALAVSAAISGTILLAWIIPPLSNLLPAAWSVMKVNTALFILGSSASLFLSQPRRSQRHLLLSRVAAGVVALLTVLTLAEYYLHISLFVDTLLAADAHSPLPGRPSLQTCWSFLVLAVILGNIRSRKRALATFIDSITLLLCLMMLIFFSGYVFGALHLYGLSLATRMAPQTLFCLALLTFAVFNRRSEYGVFGILLGSGIGGRTARLAAPWAVLLPFLLSVTRGLIQHTHLIPEEYALALTASIMSLCGFCLILALSRRTDTLENAIRDLSLRDELTGLYNRRGFYFLAEQALRLAQRAGSPFFVLFVDMDNLKVINDVLGHEIGSERLKQIAALMEQTFRETDVISRLGGDEFVVAGRADAIDLVAATLRLNESAASAVGAGSDLYPVSFSLGYVISARGSGETLDELIEQADHIMYQAKRDKKRAVAHGVFAPV